MNFLMYTSILLASLIKSIRTKQTTEQLYKHVDGVWTEAEATAKKYISLLGTNKLSEERLKQALEAESKLVQLKTAMHRLEERVSDMKSENQILQHALVTSPFKRGLEYPPTPTTKNLENGHHANEESRMNEPQGSTPAKNLGMESSSNLKRPPIDRQHEGCMRIANMIDNTVNASIYVVFVKLVSILLVVNNCEPTLAALQSQLSKSSV